MTARAPRRRTSCLRTAGLTAALVAALLGGLAGPASAHPLGNFTVNTADALVVEDDGVRVTHVVDLAEIPTVQLQGTWDQDGDGRLSEGELQRYADSTCAEDLSLITLTAAGSEVPLTVESAQAQTLPGEAGLPTTLLTCELRGAATDLEQVAFSDNSSDGRTGWREVTAVARCGELTASDVPAVSPSGLLTAYPESLLSSPVDVRAASLTVASGPCSDAASSTGNTRAERTAVPGGLGSLAGSVTDFLGRDDLTLPFALLSLLVAVVFGAVHALAPGHGKTVLAAYLVGQRGTRRQAVQLGAVVTFAHTASVLLLGAVLALGTLAAPERVVPVTEVLSGVLLALVGTYLLVLAVRRRRGLDAGHSHTHSHGHDHPHDEHGHDHPHPHAEPHVHDEGPHRHDEPEQSPTPLPVPAGRGGAVAVATAPVHSHGGRAHSHALPEGPLTWKTLVGMGVAGGLVPSPSALVVLLGATYLGRAWFGVVLVLAYGVGMAGTLTVAGLLLLRAQAALDRRGWSLGRDGRWGRLLPLATAGLVVVLGLVLVVRGVLTASTLG